MECHRLHGSTHGLRFAAPIYAARGTSPAQDAGWGLGESKPNAGLSIICLKIIAVPRDFDGRIPSMRRRSTSNVLKWTRPPGGTRGLVDI